MTDMKFIARAIIEKRQTSTSFIMTKFSLGFVKAQQIMNELEELGVISTRNEDGDRQVLASVSQLDTIFANYTPKPEPTDTKSITIMKYQAKDDKYYFVVKDKFDIPDEVERLDFMNDLRDKMLTSGEMKKHLWTKETILI